MPNRKSYERKYICDIILWHLWTKQETHYQELISLLHVPLQRIASVCYLRPKKKQKNKKKTKQNKTKKNNNNNKKTNTKTHTHKRRVQLFKNDKKTDSCVLIETYLEIQLIPDQTIKRVCNNCQRSLNTIQSRVQVHKQNDEKTVSQLKKITWSFEQKEAAVRWFASDSIQKNLSRPYIPRPCASKFILYNSVYII